MPLCLDTLQRLHTPACTPHPLYHCCLPVATVVIAADRSSLPPCWRADDTQLWLLIFLSLLLSVCLSERDLDEVLQTTAIFANVGKGIMAAQEDLQVRHNTS